MATRDFRTAKFNFKNFYTTHFQRMENAKDAFCSIAGTILADEGIEVHTLHGRIKNREEAVRKFSRKYQEALEEQCTAYEIKDYITDLIGVRIVILYESEIERVGEALKREFSVMGVTDKTRMLENGDNTFGYKGLHLDLAFSPQRLAMREYQPFADLQFEVQIRTIVQDAWSVLDHKIKYKKAIPKYLERRINSLAALFEIADREFLSVHQATQKEEEQAKVQPNVKANINAFTFTQLMQEELPHLRISESHVGEVVAHILSYGDMSYETLKQGLHTHMGVLNQFINGIRAKLGKYFDPDVFFVVLHLLYLIDPIKYKGIFMGSDSGFVQWCAENNVLNKAEKILPDALK